MDLKFFLLLTVFVIGISCQLFDQSIVDQTKYLQQIERYGKDFSQSYNQGYQHLKNLTGFGPHQNQSSVQHENRSGFNNAYLHSNGTHAFNSTERFLNKTLSTMPKGVCIKEVPTASLLQANEAFIAGNGSDPSLSRIQVCCEGYQRNIHNFRKCDPICKTECVNGFCAAPDTCLCFPDHVRNLGGFCLPTCPIMCGNGFCNQDNTCTCKDGFVIEPVDKKFCIPKCSNGCFNGNCTAPEECTCNKGFSFSAAGRCESHCSQGCANGNCVRPEVCECHKGYFKVNNVCEPICSRGCENGICVAPEVCQCSGNGWALDPSATKCVASCDKPCLNGICSGQVRNPNQCSCRNGYALDSFDNFRCVPKCEPPCSNGVCSGPNMCICYQGYVKDRSIKGSQQCIKA